MFIGAWNNHGLVIFGQVWFWPFWSSRPGRCSLHLWMLLTRRVVRCKLLDSGCMCFFSLTPMNTIVTYSYYSYYSFFLLFFSLVTIVFFSSVNLTLKQLTGQRSYRKRGPTLYGTRMTKTWWFLGSYWLGIVGNQDSHTAKATPSCEWRWFDMCRWCHMNLSNSYDDNHYWIVRPSIITAPRIGDGHTFREQGTWGTWMTIKGILQGEPCPSLLLDTGHIVSSENIREV